MCLLDLLSLEFACLCVCVLHNPLGMSENMRTHKHTITVTCTSQPQADLEVGGDV